MAIKPIYSTKLSTEEIVSDLDKQYKEAFSGSASRMVVYFTTSNTDVTALGEKLKAVFGDADILGCSTSGEIVSGQMLKNSVVALVFDKEEIADVKIELVKGIKEGKNVEDAFKSFESHYGKSMKEMSFKEHIGIILVDGMSGAEEKLMEKIGDLTNIQFIGASAGDDLKFKETFVSANGQTSSNATVLALLKPAKGFDIIKTQSFCSANKKLLATKVDEANREVLEFNNKPASEAYAEALGVSVEEAADCFMKNPVGLMVDNEPYVRSPQQFVGKNMRFYCNIKEGMELDILESGDIVADTKKAVEDKIKELGKISGLINFNCILRTLELEKENKTEEYGKIFSDIPAIGFSTYGEEYIGHINQTSTILVFK